MLDRIGETAYFDAIEAHRGSEKTYQIRRIDPALKLQAYFGGAQCEAKERDEQSWLACDKVTRTEEQDPHRIVAVGPPMCCPLLLTDGLRI